MASAMTRQAAKMKLMDATIGAGVKVSVTAWCEANGVSRRTCCRHRRRIAQEGSWQPRSRRPKTSPGATPAPVAEPVLIDGAAPIRLQGRNATADRARLAQLFSESPRLTRSAGRRLPAPDLPSTPEGEPSADFIIRAGMLIPVDDAATWRPLSERR
jgi:hypothetical protein